MNYNDWNQNIAAKFYHSQQSQKPVYLYIDNTCLQEIGVAHGIAPESSRADFIQAVRSRIYFKQNRTQPFFKFFQWRAWENVYSKQDPTTPPPFIGFLGFCVLAASEMTVDDTRNISSGNYYARLNELLGRSNTGKPTGFEETERAWLRLNQWLGTDLEGKLGLPTANTDLYGKYVGYPISQALMRRTDIEELPDFYHWCGLEPGEMGLDTTYFEQQLRIWAHRTTCSFSKQIRQVFANDKQKHISAIANMTLSNYEQWDGSKTVRGDGLRITEITIQLYGRRRFRVALHPRAPQDFPEGNYGATTLTRVGGTEWFEPLSNILSAQWLNRKALNLQRDHYRIKLDARPVVPLRRNNTSELSDWLSCNRVKLGERHRILCHHTLSEQVAHYLDEHADSGWRKMTGKDAMTQDWVCFINVRITEVAEPEHKDLNCLTPALQVGIRLSGGLLLKHGVWLQGGEPEAIISSKTELPILLDGKAVATTAAGSTVLNLQTFALSEGNHILQVGDKISNFALSKPGNDLLGNSRFPRWGYPFRRESDTQFKPLSLTARSIPATEDIPSGQLYISGTHILHSAADPPPPRQHMIILPYGAQRYVILGRRIGEVLEPDLPTMLPEWQADGYLQGYKQQIPFKPQWLISISHRNNYTLRPLGHPEDAMPDPVEGADTEKWLQWVRKRNLRRQLSRKHEQWAHQWDQYSKIARSTISNE